MLTPNSAPLPVTPAVGAEPQLNESGPGVRLRARHHPQTQRVGPEGKPGPTRCCMPSGPHRSPYSRGIVTLSVRRVIFRLGSFELTTSGLAANEIGIEYEHPSDEVS